MNKFKGIGITIAVLVVIFLFMGPYYILEVVSYLKRFKE